MSDESCNVPAGTASVLVIALSMTVLAATALLFTLDQIVPLFSLVLRGLGLVSGA